ncbi:MAG: molybdopterin oxidoreductase family protein, partial [Halobacteriales archaeon]
MTREESPPTVCPLCSVGCRLERGPEDARAAGVAGPANPEGRLCRKGVGAFQPRAERLARPQVRRDGDLEPVDWETALEAVVERFERAREAGGPGALGFLGAPRCTTEENYLLGKLARTLGTNDVDNRARLCHDGVTGELAERVGWPATTNGLEELREADVVLVAGADPAERQPVAFDSFVRPAVNGGATLVHLDPVGNRTTCLADVHLAPRPGTDAHLLDLLSAAVLEAGGADRAFLDRRTAGFEAFADGLRALDRERARRVAGVGADAVSRVADLIAG